MLFNLEKRLRQRLRGKEKIYQSEIRCGSLFLTHTVDEVSKYLHKVYRESYCSYVQIVPEKTRKESNDSCCVYRKFVHTYAKTETTVSFILNL